MDYEAEQEKLDLDEREYLMDNFVPHVHFELLPITSLVSNQDYQRNISMQHIKKVAQEFDICQINPVKVSRRDGVNYVFDGQHTIEIIAMAAGTRNIPVWCMIYDDLEYNEEADIFANQMKHKKSLRPFEIFNAHVEAGNEKQLIIKELVESYDLEITATTTPRGITAVNALEWIYDKYGFEGLDRTLMLAVGAWESAPGSLGGSVLKGIAILCDAYKDGISDEAFMDRIGRLSIKELIRTAKERGVGAQCYAEVLLMEYNKRTKQKLQWAKLYASRSKKGNNRYEISDMIDELEREGIDPDIMSTDYQDEE